MKTKKVAKNIIKRCNTYYSDFSNNLGKRIRKSLGKDLVQAKIQVLQLIANPAIQEIQADDPTPRTKSVKFLAAVEQFIEYWYGIKDALKDLNGSNRSQNVKLRM